MAISSLAHCSVFTVLLLLSICRNTHSANELHDTEPGYTIRGVKTESATRSLDLSEGEGKVTDHSKNMGTPDYVCDFCLYDGFGNITSYNYPLPYGNDMECTYRVVRADNDTCQLSLVFHDFDLETDSDGNCKDYISVGSRKFCSSELKGQTEILEFPREEKQMTFKFKTDSSGQRKGFYVEIQRVHGTCRDSKENKDLADLPAPPSCYFCSDGLEERLISYGYPANYRNNMQCVYEIKKPQGSNYCAVQMQFSEFDLEESFKCDKDFLAVDGEKYCGTSLATKSKTVKFDEDGKVRLVFKTDADTNKKGFSLIYKQIACARQLTPNAVCDETFQSSEFTIRSPNYPENYINQANCHYRILRQNENVCSLEFTFITFDIETSENCQYDYLEINGQRICGSISTNTKKTFDFRSSEKTLNFRSDEASNRQGFLIKVAQKSCTESPRLSRTPDFGTMCQFRYVGINGKFESPGYPNEYPNNLDCGFRFLQQDGYCGVELDFEQFMLEGSVECSMDYVFANNRKYCGNQLQGSKLVMNFNEDTFETNFKFLSNEKTTSPGFTGTYKQIPCRSNKDLFTEVTLKPPTLPPPSSETCDKTITAFEYELRSPDYPLPYPNNRKCRYTVQRRDSRVCKLQMTFDKFELESNEDCLYDNLIVDGKKLCGSMPMRTVREIPFKNFEILLEFNSDEASNNAGFVVNLKQIDCEDDQQVTTPRQPSCDQTFDQALFQIKSPGYPSLYPEGSSCTFVVNRASENVCQLLLEIEQFDLAPAEDCINEYLMVDSERLCGSLPRKTVRKYSFRESQKILNFQSAVDFSTGHLGFLINVEQVECPFQTFNIPAATIRPPRAENCDKSYDSENFEILSPQFPGKYPNQADCTYIINKSRRNICKVEMQFIRFDVESSENCQYDHVIIDGEKICGTLQQGSKREYDFTSDQLVMKFRSDEASARMGFLIRVRQMECDREPTFRNTNPIVNVCNKTINEGLVELKSPNYPLNYPNQASCTYTVNRLNDKICSLEVTYLDFDVESSENCQFDYLDVYGERMCGVIPAGNVKTFAFKGSQKIIQFKSDEASNRAGFHLLLRQKPCETATLLPTSRKFCNQLFQSPSFVISSPNFPGNYPSNSECIYSIAKSGNDICSIDITVLEFDVGTESDCSRDYFQIEGQKLCGVISRGSSRTVSFQGSSIQMKFRSLAGVSRRGFQMQVVQNKCNAIPKTLPTAAPICDLSFTRKQFTLKSTNYPAGYPNNQDCVFKIERAVNVCNLRLEFATFDVEESQSCVNDYLEVDGSRLCGSFTPNTIRELPFDTVVKRLRFHSNLAVSRPGYYIRVTQVECVNTPTQARIPLLNLADSSCSETFQQSTFQISTPNYPLNYPNGAVCRYVINKSRPDICQLQMTFDKFEVEASPNCTADYLEITGMRICGTMPDNRQRIFEFVGNSLVLMFKSDGITSRSGYNIKLAQIPCSNTNQPISVRTPAPATRRPLSGCENNFYSNSGGFRSENHPKNYPDNYDCKFQFLKTEGYCGVELTFEEFSLEESEGCTNDYVSINGFLFCGRQLQGQKKTIPFDSRPEASFMFVSDNSRTSTGFNGRYKLVPCEVQGRSTKATCDIVTNSPNLELTSPGYPANYENLQNCEYEIQKSNSFVCALELNFLKFDIESNDGCHRDYFLADGQKFCGTLPAPQTRVIPFKPFESRKTLKFHSDEIRSRSGFRIQVRQIDNCPGVESRQNDALSVPPPPLCDFCLHNETGYMTSLNYPGNYPNNVYCSYRIKALPGFCSVKVAFQEFDLEQSSNCRNDFLQVQGERQCGQSLNQQTLNFMFEKSNELQFMFVTNDQATGRGFHAKFQQQRCQNQARSNFRSTFVQPNKHQNSKGGYSFHETPSTKARNNNEFLSSNNLGFSNGNSRAARLNPAIIVSKSHYIKTGTPKPARNQRSQFSPKSNDLKANGNKFLKGYY